MRVTLHGAIPVYVQVDTESGEVMRVIASDEEFFYVGEQVGFEPKDGVERKGFVEANSLVAPTLAYYDDGVPLALEHYDEREKAVEIAEQVAWPRWEWGW